MAELNQPGFSRDTFPNLYHNPPFGVPYENANRAAFAPSKQVEPARDARYPAYAGTMQDGRLVTDYRPHCARNIPPASQYASKKWMVHHADQIMEESRMRQVEWTGASLAMANTVPPPANIVHSNKFYSEIVPSGARQGLGVERADSAAPPLFGTFSFDPTLSEIRTNRKNIALTSYYEGGRNTPRGAF
jgi:hypothetical protein